MTHVYIPRDALVLVGDGSYARLLRNRGTPVNPELIVESELTQENPPTHEQGTDRAAEERFAHKIAQQLYQMAHAGQFYKLVVVAPPKTLGALRSAFHPKVSAAVVAEVAKDLTTHPAPDLARMLM